MKILIQQPTEPVLEGIVQALISMEEPISVWNPQTPFNDAIDMVKPELTIGYPESITSRPDCKLVLVGCNTNNLSPDLLLHPPTPQHKSSKVLIMEPAANFAYTNFCSSPDYQTDLFYYSVNTSPETLSILAKIEQNYQLKIIGPHRIPLVSYLGVGDVDDVMKFMKSCKIAMAFDIHTLYTYAVNRVFCVTNQDTDLFPQIDKLEDIAKHTGEKIDKIVDASYNYVVSDHTYFHRVYDIFARLGYLELAEKAIQCLKKIQTLNHPS